MHLRILESLIPNSHVPDEDVVFGEDVIYYTIYSMSSEDEGEYSCVAFKELYTESTTFLMFGKYLWSLKLSYQILYYYS